MLPLVLNVPANALIHPIEPDDVLGVVPVLSVDKCTVRDPVGSLKRLRPGEKERATIESSGLEPNAVVRVSFPLRRETDHGKGTSGAPTQSGSSRNDAVGGDSLKVPVRGVVAQLWHRGKDFRHARCGSELWKVPEGGNPPRLQGILANGDLERIGVLADDLRAVALDSANLQQVPVVSLTRPGGIVLRAA